MTLCAELEKAKRLLELSRELIAECELINDSVEGWLNTKEKPSREMSIADLVDYTQGE